MISTKIPRLVFFFLFLSKSLIGDAACIDVVDLDVELPPQSVTDRGTIMSYQYDLVTDEYYLSWTKADFESEEFGPFHLTMSCGTASLKWENDEFLVLTRGCGTFCWYAKIFSLAESNSSGTPAYQKIERPLSLSV